MSAAEGVNEFAGRVLIDFDGIFSALVDDPADAVGFFHARQLDHAANSPSVSRIRS